MQYSLVPFLLITSSLLVSINLQSSLCAAQTVKYANCSQPITCGSVKSSISYPFWGANRPEYCGKSGFEVTCQGNITMISMKNIDFRILNMSSSVAGVPTVKVAREDYWTTICPSNYVATSLNFSHFTYASGVQNVSFYYGCNAAATASFAAFAATMGISVSSFTHACNSSFSVSYLTETQTAKISDPSTNGACSNVVLVPVSATATQELDSNQTSIQTAIDGGFDLNVQNDDTALCNNCLESGGVCGQNTATNAPFMCFCQSSSSTNTTCTGNSLTNPSSSGKSPTMKIAITVVGALGVGALGAILIIYISRKKMIFFKKGKKNEFDIEAFIRNYGSIAPVRYSYSNVLKMTNSFEDQIGKGGYGTVYKGTLPDGLPVAVKVLSETKGDGEEFINEVASIGRTSHVNVVTLSGFCYERNKRALIYEYMPNGSLDKFIHNQGSFKANCHLEWKTLSEIAVGVARGLEYLHRGCNTRILHFDIKPQNILLDKDFCPKISDFGLAKLCKTKESIVSMLGTRGTAGYIAPEVFSRNFGGVSHKSDVYSYGMLVLEMVGARRNLHSEVSHTSEMFPHYVYKDLELDNDESIFRAIPEEENEIVRKMILISLGCIQTIPFDRPSMSKVVEMLEGPLHSLTVPPKPILFPPTRSTTDEQTGTYEEESMLTSQASERS